MRIEDDQIVLDDGYPEGSTVHGLSPEEGDELARLSIFMFDLNKAIVWMRLLESEQVPDEAKDAVLMAGMLKLMGCFESTAGLRQRPLRPKKLFSRDERAELDRLKFMRNKMVAHDEQIRTGAFPFIVLDREGYAIRALALCIQSPLHSFSREVSAVKRLAEKAHQWVSEEFERRSQAITDEFNALPSEARSKLKADKGFTLTVREDDLITPGKGGRKT